jgi:predicted enzyme related to lactoylglutathione lyase
MTTRDTTWPEGTPCWVDLSVPDFELAREFYGTLFGWHIERGPEDLHGYAGCTKDGHVVAGLMPALDPSQPRQGRSHTGFELANEPGSVTWNENMSRAWEQNKQFYQAVLGLEYDDLPGEIAYATFKASGVLAGGIGVIGEDWPTEVSAHWATYFKVADADEAVAVVERLGGKVTQPPWDTEFGRMAAVTDNQGVGFMVMADPR